jgi:hypothetical protein
MKKKILGAFPAVFLSVSSFAQEAIPGAGFRDYPKETGRICR